MKSGSVTESRATAGNSARRERRSSAARVKVLRSCIGIPECNWIQIVCKQNASGFGPLFHAHSRSVPSPTGS